MSEQSIFYQASQLSGEEREAFLQEKCGDDLTARQRLDKLLHAVDHATDFLEEPAVAQIDVAEILESEEKAAAMSEQSENDPSNQNFKFLKPSEDPEVMGLIDRFEVRSVVGKGGMGIVFKARDPELDRIVAIKVLHEDKIPPFALAASRKRFIREARSMATFHSDYVIRVHEVQKDNQPPFFAMEYIHGKSLQQKIDKEGPLEVEDMLRIGIEIASGLVAAHESPNKLVHRDIKPANILLENGIERVKIVDFGLAKDSLDNSNDITSSNGEILGTVPFMSPEQAQSRIVDTRTDLFSLGATLYCMATGYPPFRGNNLTKLLHKVVSEDPIALNNVRPELPPGFCEIVSRLMQKRPDKRIQSASEIVSLLKDELTQVQEPQAAPSSLFDKTIIGETPDSEEAPNKKSSRPWYQISNGYLKIASVILLIGILSIGAIYYFNTLPDNERIDPDEFFVK
ncbi:serine/threonine-protein kinase [uncultured Rubinisphaera sp.]|uniref:serine/threonine protein kinase n=1 Tax=uncultured Rubinisphaera sp. TaxID=1678686 RepID=UPI0030D76AE0